MTRFTTKYLALYPPHQMSDLGCQRGGRCKGSTEWELGGQNVVFSRDGDDT
jgi:hypothetical protein